MGFFMHLNGTLQRGDILDEENLVASVGMFTGV